MNDCRGSINPVHLQWDDALVRVLESSPLGMLVVDGAFRILLASAGAAAGFAKKSSLIGSEFGAVLRQVWRERRVTEALERLQQTIATGESRRSQEADQEQTLEVAGFNAWQIDRLALPNGQWGAVCHFYDNTPGMKAESALRASEERYRALVKASSDVAYGMSADWSVMLPLDGRGLVASNVEPIREWMARNLPAEEHERARAAIAKAVEERGLFELEHQVFRPDGSIGWTSSRAVPILDDRGNVTEWFGTASDITDKKRAEAALRESEERFRNAVGAASDILWTNTPNGKMKGEQPGWSAFTGQSRGEYEDYGWASAVHPEDAQGSITAWEEAVREKKTFIFEHRVRRRDGEYRLCAIRAVPVLSDDSSIREWVGVHTDITEKRRNDEMRERLLESERAARLEAERAGQMKDEFLATLSHEIRTPLNAILGWAEIMQGSKDPRDMETGLEVIRRNARSQAKIINDLLDMSGIISGKVRLDVQRVDLAGIVRAAVETARPTAEAKGVRLRAVLDPLQGMAVRGDINRLQQILWNLLSNAIKFTPREGRVEVVLERVESHLEISVADTGEGIEPGFLPFVFDRFRQADASTTRRHGGLGLGLSIVKQLVELHGGSVVVKSAGRGKGAAFVVTLPVKAVQQGPELREQPSAQDQTAGELVPAPENIAGVRVLIVDDEEDARALIGRLLRGSKAVVTAAACAKEAIEALETSTFDVLISDIGMPEQDGFALIRQVRMLDKDRGGRIPAIALTAYARTEDRIRAVSAGFLMHVAKPVEPAELITMVAAAAGRM